jgi:hypothetical protein
VAWKSSRSVGWVTLSLTAVLSVPSGGGGLRPAYRWLADQPGETLGSGYETAELMQHLLVGLGGIDRNGLDDTAVYGHLPFWNPWWIPGGVLFALADWRNRPVRAPARP